MDELERGLMYKEGRGVKKNYKEAIKCFLAAADKNNPMAYAHLGMMYEDGLGVKEDLTKTLEYYIKAAKLGFAWAQCRVGLMHARGMGIEKDDATAIDWYQQAASQGDKDAQFNLGMMLAHGRGGEMNVPLSLEWLDKAAAQGHRDALTWAIKLRDELVEPANSNNNSKYSYEKDGIYFLLSKKSQPLLTPMGSRVKTGYEPLAQRLVKHLETYGEDPQDPVSIVAFHYSMIDFFVTMPREELERSVLSGLKRENDWTFNCPTADPEPMMQWMALFGAGEDRINKAVEWVKSLRLMQLCAVCVIGRAMESVNIPYIVASQLEGKHLKQYAKAVNQFYPYVPTKDMVKYFENLIFYFNVENPISSPKMEDKLTMKDGLTLKERAEKVALAVYESIKAQDLARKEPEAQAREMKQPITDSSTIIEQAEQLRQTRLKMLVETNRKFHEGDRSVPHFQIKEAMFQPITDLERAESFLRSTTTSKS